MKIEKVKFEKLDRFKELIELTGLVSYSVDSDEGRDIIINLKCEAEGHAKKELHEFIYDFHAEYFHFWPGKACLKVVNNEIEISWRESRNLIYEEVESDFYLVCKRLFSIPADSSLEQILSFQFEISGSITSTLLIDQFVFLVQFDKSEINEQGFTVNELKRIKRGLLFYGKSRLRAFFEKGIRRLLRQYKVGNSTFSLSGDECFLSTFDCCEIKPRKLVISKE